MGRRLNGGYQNDITFLGRRQAHGRRWSTRAQGGRPTVIMTTSAAPEWFTATLEALRAGDVDGFVQMYDDDAVHEFPFTPEGRPQRLEDKSAIAEYMKDLPAIVQFDSFDDVRFREAGDELIVERPRLTLPGLHEPAAALIVQEMRNILIAGSPPCTVAMHLSFTVLPPENLAEPASVTCNWTTSVRPAARNL